jgi:hypothetical protein
MLFATLALWTGLTYLRKGTSRWQFLVCLVLLMYTHYMGALLLALFFLAGLVGLSRKCATDAPPVRVRNWVTVHLLAVLAWMPWQVAIGVRLVQRWDELKHLQHRATLSDLHLLASYMSVSASAAASWPWPVTLVAILAGVAPALLAMFPHSGASRLFGLADATVAAFVLLLVVVSAATGAWLVQPRYVALVLPLALTLIASGATIAWYRLGKARTPLRAIALLLIGTWLLAQVGGLRAFYTNPVHGHDGVREIGALLGNDVRDGDLVLSNHQLLSWSIAQYYSGPIQALPESRDVRDGYLLWPGPDVLDFAPSQITVLQPLLDKAQPQGVCLLYLHVMDPNKLLLAKLGEKYPGFTLHHFAYCDLYLFDSAAK